MSQNAKNAENAQSEPIQIIKDEEMNFIVLRAFNIIRERNEPRLLKFISIFSKFRNAGGQCMFNFVNSEGNNIFMEACNYGLTNVSLRIVKSYNNLFKLGLSNSHGMTALMICINKNMYLTTFELLNFPDAIPELTNNNIRFNTIDLVLRQNLRDGNEIHILAELIRFFLEFNPNSQGFHRNLNEICTDEYLVQNLQREIPLDVLDFSKICAPIEQAQAETVIPQRRSNLADVRNISYNTRNITQNIQEAREYHDDRQIAQPANDMNFDANNYTSEQLERLRLRKRGPPSGGRKKHPIKKTKCKKLQCKKTTCKKRKYRRFYKRKRSLHHK